MMYRDLKLIGFDRKYKYSHYINIKTLKHIILDKNNKLINSYKEDNKLILEDFKK